MLYRARQFISSKNFKQITDTKNIPSYLFTMMVLAIAWSGVKTIQDNYELQKKIAVLSQQNEVLRLQNDNTKLQNKYYDTGQYLDLAARQSLGLAGPGEKVILVPNAIAAKYVNQDVAAAVQTKTNSQSKSKYTMNMQAWRDFLLGRKIVSD